jgi:hypothetical protein
MAKAAASIVFLSSHNRNGTQSFPEAQAGAGIAAGHMLTLDHTTTPPTATASDGTVPWDQLYIALEKVFDDANTADAIDALYVAGDVVRYVSPVRGDRLNVIAEGAITIDAIVIDGGATQIGTFLTSGTIDATTIANTLKAKALTTGVDGLRFDIEVL